MYTSANDSLIQCAFFLKNKKCVTSDKVQQEERKKKSNWKHPQGTVISVNEVWHHILKYPEVINNIHFFMIQRTLLETRTGKSPQNMDNPKNKDFTQSDANVTNNPEKIVRRLNELIQ